MDECTIPLTADEKKRHVTDRTGNSGSQNITSVYIVRNPLCSSKNEHTMRLVLDGVDKDCIFLQLKHNLRTLRFVSSTMIG